MMKPGYWIAAVTVGVALVGVWHFTQPPLAARAARAVSSQESSPASMPSSSAAPAPGSAAATPDTTPTAAQVTQWIADTNHADAAHRATAIDALARAPREQALPVLRRLATQGDAATDRPHALNSLRELALEQGDADGGIREAIREVRYHGDDESLASSAQEVLDVVEESELK
jgi:hypothetical protein